MVPTASARGFVGVDGAHRRTDRAGCGRRGCGSKARAGQQRRWIGSRGGGQGRAARARKCTGFRRLIASATTIAVEAPTIPLGRASTGARSRYCTLELPLPPGDTLGGLHVQLLSFGCGPAALAETVDHHGDSLVPAGDGQRLAHANAASRFCATAGDLDVATRNGLSGKHTGAKEARRPEPAIKSNTLVHDNGCSQSR